MNVSFQNLDELKSRGSSEVTEALHVSLMKLTPTQRMVVHLRFWEQLEIEQIAIIMDMSWAAVDQLLEKTFSELRRMLEDLFQSRSVDHAA